MRAVPDTKARIKEAALALFAAQGVGETSVRDLAAAAGIAEGTLYRHYAAKEELIRDLFAEHYAAFAERLDRLQGAETGLRAKLGAVTRDACRLFDEEPTLYRFLLLVQHEALRRLPAGAAGPSAVFRRMLVAGIESGEAALSDPDLGAALLLGLLIQPAVSLVYGALEPPLSRHADAIAAAAERVLVRKDAP